jgi:PadR family transcriptional regulator, regulatory protein PadR
MSSRLCVSGLSRAVDNSLCKSLYSRYRNPIGKTMTNNSKTELLRGTLDLLILKSLSLEPLHGVGISQRIVQISRGNLRVSFGSLFPALHRIEEKGWIEAEWRLSENRRRAKYYKLTVAGRKQLKAEEQSWNNIVRIMTAAMESK